MLEQVRDRALGLLDQIGGQALVGTAALRAFGLLKIPMLFTVRPSVTQLSENQCVVKIPMSRWVQNHLNSMYIAVLAMGADVVGGLLAFQRAQKAGSKIDLIFKAMDAEFYKRVEGDAYFTCNDGLLLTEAVDRAIRTGERVNQPVTVMVTVPSHLGDTPAAKFTMNLSLKRR